MGILLVLGDVSCFPGRDWQAEEMEGSGSGAGARRGQRAALPFPLIPTSPDPLAPPFLVPQDPVSFIRVLSLTWHT